MAFDVEQFRKDFPEFGVTNPIIYSDNMINFWAGVGDSLLNSRRWDTLRNYGLELFVAHHITLAAKDQKSSSMGNYSGQDFGLVNNKSVGGVSVGYDVQSIIESNGGNYNLTSYGRSFIRLARIVGMGGAQINGDPFE